jgi:hydroxypyruvate isomerase
VAVPKFSPNLSMLFSDRPFLHRFEAAARCGFSRVEFQLPEAAPDEVARALRETGLQLVLFNLPAGDWARGERGIAADPARRSEFREGVREAVERARRWGCPRLNALAGRRREEVPQEEQWACLVDNLRFAARALAAAGLTLLVEPVNAYDVPGFLLNTTAQAERLVGAVGEPNVQVQCDIYHMQRAEGNLVPTLRRLLPRLGHVQIADAPDRHEPGTGEIHYPYVLRELDRMGYEGFVGLEYRPLAGTEQGLSWIERMGFARD